MKNRRFALLVCAFLSAVSFTACENKSVKDEDNSSASCVQDSFVATCQNDMLRTCNAGQIFESPCNGLYECRNNQCLLKDNSGGDVAEACTGTEPDKCVDEHTLAKCVDKKWVKSPCQNGCADAKCSENGQTAACDIETFVNTCADENTRIVCENDVETKKTCEFGCHEGVCKKSSDSKPSVCGNNHIDGDEVCDNFDIGNATCQDLEEFKGLLTSGRPVCNETCDGIINDETFKDRCQVTKCGNGIREDDEYCDVAPDGTVLHSTFPSCNDYDPRGLEYKPGGEPGCNVNCNGLSKGSCQLADQPRDGILTCEFKSLTEYNDESTGILWLTGTLNVKTDGTVDEDQLTGRVICGHRELPTYAWGYASEADSLSVSSDAGAADNELTLTSSVKVVNWGPGQYDCAFQVNTHNGNQGYYNCPIVEGYPGESGIVDDDKIRTYDVEGQEVVGDVIASWSLKGLGSKNDQIAVARADGGANYSSAKITITEDSKGSKMMTLMTGVSKDTTTYSLWANNWSQATSLTASDRHFVVSFDTTGFENVRAQMYVQVSDKSSGQIAATYTVGNMTSTADNYSMRYTDRTWEPWSFSLDAAAQSNNVTLNLYSYGVKDPNASFRIAEIYILGDKKQ